MGGAPRCCGARRPPRPLNCHMCSRSPSYISSSSLLSSSTTLRGGVCVKSVCVCVCVQAVSGRHVHQPAGVVMCSPGLLPMGCTGGLPRCDEEQLAPKAGQGRPCAHVHHVVLCSCTGSAALAGRERPGADLRAACRPSFSTSSSTCQHEHVGQPPWGGAGAGSCRDWASRALGPSVPGTHARMTPPAVFGPGPCASRADRAAQAPPPPAARPAGSARCPASAPAPQGSC